MKSSCYQMGIKNMNGKYSYSGFYNQRILCIQNEQQGKILRYFLKNLYLCSWKEKQIFKDVFFKKHILKFVSAFFCCTFADAVVT